jgi:Uma2 family endonuclease
MAVSEKLMTAEELLALPDDGMRHELARGELITMTPAGFEHGEVALALGGVLRVYVLEKGLGKVVAAETGFRLATDPDTVRAPDVAYVAQARIPEGGSPKGFFSGAPDLAAEVVSPNDSADEVQAKVTDYLAAGARLVWVVHPKTKTVTEYKSLDEVRVLTEDDSLDGGDVVPGFSMKVRDLFA